MKKISEVKLSGLFAMPVYVRNMIYLEFPKFDLKKENLLMLNLSLVTYKKNKKTLICKLKQNGKFLKCITIINGYF